ISTSVGLRNVRNRRARSTTMTTPPENSAAANCQPIRTARMIPSSMTRFVEANSKAIAAVKFAPLRKIERASATAAYEQDDDAAPRSVAVVRLRGESLGRRRVISAFETTAWTTAGGEDPRT